ncbi:MULTISPECIES: thioredoxin family protein [Bacillus]|uniref:Thioredoxin n=2 Tax=Bacillus cereus group TaxID=86661 RepID=A0A161TTP1_BACCE|nr:MULTISPECIES: thioredoxin family protein [Bacillus]KZD62900.1 Thioredoxin [Bacillus cereus]NEK98432.1 thioredoxin family protein [Bacillus mobilis]TSI09937.1 thioredoxin family protein [Bacillus sp. HY001]SMD81746.1 thioredoxin 2 [Bacillus mobilis]
MKKLLLFSVVIISAFFVISVIQKGNMSKKIQESKLQDGNYYKNSISIEKLKADLINNKNHVIYFYKEGCQYCEQVSPIIVPMTKDKNISMKVVNLGEYPIGEWDNFEIEAVPTIVEYRNGKESNRIEGAHDELSYKDWFNKVK